MRRAKKTSDSGADSRPKLTVTGIGKIIGVSRATMYAPDTTELEDEAVPGPVG